MSGIIHWSPMVPGFFEDIDKFLTEFGGNRQGGFSPAIDVYQTEKEVIVETSIPGVDPDKIDVSVENDVLTIQGNTEHKSEVDEKNYYRQEVRSGSFYRVVPLPAHVDSGKTNAVYEKGMLKITLPKASKKKVKSIKVKKKEE